MTLHYKDISSYQKGIAVSGSIICIKATEGTFYTSSDYGPAVVRAHSAGTWPFAYHFLHQGNASAQAEYCYARVGKMPLMVDWEPTGSSYPGVSDAAGFIDSYRARGGVTNALYFPHWYWQQLGSPSLQPFINRKMFLVSSCYTVYTDDPAGDGWRPYGGMTPKVWQHTAFESYNGFANVDCNAYRGTSQDLIGLVSGSNVPPPAPSHPAFPYPSGHFLGQPSQSPFCHSGYYGGVDTVNVHTWQAKMVNRGWSLVTDGRFGPGSEEAARAFQAEKGLMVDGRVGRDTWNKTWDAKVT